MLDIKKISENFYLIGGEYITDNFNSAVIIANEGIAIKGFIIENKLEISSGKYIKLRIIEIFKKLWKGVNEFFNKLEDLM
jgi:hypothetical protein